MKIVKQSTTELVLATDNSWGIRAFSLIWGIGFAGIPLSMAFITARSGESMNYPNLLREDGVSKFPSSKECFLRFFEPSCSIPPQ